MSPATATALVLTALTLAPTAPLHAQGTTFGVRGGISVASADFDEATFDASNRTGFVGGVFLDYASSGLLGFQIGAQYTQKGAELDLGAAREDFDLAYLEIPAVVKLGLPLGPLRPSVFGGAALGFKASCESGGEDCDDDTTGTDFSGVAGADVSLDLGGLSLWADARYHFGLSDISDSADVVGDLRNRAWLLQVGIGF